MLIEFKVENYRSFKDEQTLSMVAFNKRKNEELPGNCIDAGKLRLVRSAGIFGPNASGKSNLIKAITVLKSIVKYSTEIKPGTPFPIEPFGLSESTISQPTRFEIVFEKEGIKFLYGLAIKNSIVLDEWLVAYPEGKPQTWFQRKHDSNEKETKWYFGPKLKGDKWALAEKTRDDSLFISVAAKWNHNQLIPVYKWFAEDILIVPSKELDDEITALLLHKADIDNVKTFRENILRLIKNADLGISDVKSRPLDKEEFATNRTNIPKAFQKFLYDSGLGPKFNTVVYHSSGESSVTLKIDLEDDSAGTQRLFQIAGHLEVAMTLGKVLIIDEIDSSMHPFLVKKIIELFNDSDINQENAQLLYTSHDTTILTPSLLRRDQIWFTEKDNKGATILFPLSEFKPRKNEYFQKSYLSGRYGALPFLDFFGESCRDQEENLEKIEVKKNP